MDQKQDLVDDDGQSEVFDKLLGMGGHWVWDSGHAGSKEYVGVEVTLQTVASVHLSS